MKKYVDFKVSSGLVVQIAPRTYAEWEEYEEARLVVGDELPVFIAEKREREADLYLQRKYRDLRTEKLKMWVKDFPVLRDKLTMRDIMEIEAAAEKLEEMEIPLGNSEAGGSGT